MTTISQQNEKREDSRAWLLFKMTISAPFIYGVIVPALLLDIFLFFYQNTCFRIYKIPFVRREDHFRFDRRLLPYLHSIEKINCLYCSYFNGLIGFAREIGGRTERYWCPIKNAKRRFDPHSQYEDFFDYGDEKTYRKHLKQKRTFDDLRS